MSDPLRVGFMLPATYAFSQGNGIRAEAELKIAGLAALGAECTRLDPWHWCEPASLDVIHFFYGGLQLADIAEARRAKPRKLVFSTTIDSNQGHLPYRLMALLGGLSQRFRTIQGEFRRQALASDLVVVRSRHEALRVEKGLGIYPRRIRLVHLGVETAGIDAHLVAATPRDGIFHLSAFGQERKNVLRLIAAAGPTGLRLTIAGSCPDPAALARIRAAAAPFANITIVGYLDAEARNALYLRSRVFALPSIHEGTGLSALEAAVRGCQVVITRNGGPPDYFAETGRLIDPLDVAELRAALVAAHADPTPPAAVAARAAERFSLASTARTLLAAYRE